MLLERLSSFGKDYAAPGTCIELGPEFLLERLDLSAQHRLSDRQSDRSSREGTGLRNRNEVFELTQFHPKPVRTGFYSDGKSTRFTNTILPSSFLTML